MYVGMHMLTLWGPSRKISLGCASYMLTIIEDYSRKVWPYFMKHKYEAFDAFKKWKVMIERQTEKKVNGFILKVVWNFVQIALMITTAMKALSDTTLSHTILNRMV
jgi:hypothetical protein